MSGENLADDTLIKKKDPGVSSTNPHQKVDINNLFAKLKKEEKSKKKRKYNSFIACNFSYWNNRYFSFDLNKTT